MPNAFWRFDKNLGAIPSLVSASVATNTMAPPMSIPDGYTQYATNVKLSETRFLQPRLGLSLVSTSGGPTESIRYVFVDRISGSEVIWTVTGTSTLSAFRSNASVSLSDTTADGDPMFCAYNGKVFMAYNSDQNRLHVYDTAESSPVVRRVGVVAPSAPSVANTGAGSYTATIRYYKVQMRVYVDGSTSKPISASSELSSATSFTPSGSGTAARVTKPTTVDSATHWVVYASSDNLTFFDISGPIAVGTTTYDDSAAVSSYSGNEVAPEAGLFVPPPSAKFLATNGERLIMAGSWETTASSGQTTPSPRRVWFTRPLGATDAGDDESITSTELSRYWLDIDAEDGSEITGLVSTSDGSVYVGTSTSLWRLIETGSADTPFRAERVASGVGITNGYAVKPATARDGSVAIYFMSKSGPYRYSPSGGIEFLGFETVGGVSNTGTTYAVGFDPSQNEVQFSAGTSASADVFNISVRANYPYGGWSANTYFQNDAAVATVRIRSFAVYNNRLLIAGTAIDGGDLLATASSTTGADGLSTFVSRVRTKSMVFGDGLRLGLTEDPVFWLHKLTSVSAYIVKDFAEEPIAAQDTIAGSSSPTSAFVITKMEGLVCADAHTVAFDVQTTATSPTTDGSDPKHPIDWMLVPYSVKEPA